MDPGISQGSRPRAIMPSWVITSVLLAWIYNGTGGSLLPVVLLHGTANLPVTLLIAPLGIDMIQPFLIFTALLIIAAIAVIGLTGSTNLSRTQRTQTSENVPTVPTPQASVRMGVASLVGS